MCGLSRWGVCRRQSRGQSLKKSRCDVRQWSLSQRRRCASRRHRSDGNRCRSGGNRCRRCANRLFRSVRRGCYRRCPPDGKHRERCDARNYSQDADCGVPTSRHASRRASHRAMGGSNPMTIPSPRSSNRSLSSRVNASNSPSRDSPNATGPNANCRDSPNPRMDQHQHNIR